MCLWPQRDSVTFCCIYFATSVRSWVLNKAVHQLITMTTLMTVYSTAVQMEIQVENKLQENILPSDVQ